MKGAEAEVSIGEEVEKRRVRKKYRHPDLDRRIAEGRTSTEANILREAARSGVNVPAVKDVGDRELVMEKIDGVELKEDLSEENARQLGENVAKLHSAGIVHGDITTRNAIVSEDGVYLIDFGLAERSERTEDRAMDLHLFRQVLSSQHSKSTEEIWRSFIDGYSSFEDREDVLARLEEVESRGRYK